MGMAASCAPLTGSSRATVRLPPLTQIEPKPTATPHGPSGTGNVRTTALVAGSIALTPLPAYEVTQTRSSPSASSHGLGIASIRATAISLARSVGDATGDIAGAGSEAGAPPD